MCEKLANEYGISNSSTAFMTGMLSGIDAMLNFELEEIMLQLPISAEISQALLHNEGILGKLLSDVKNYMTGNWDEIIKQTLMLKLSEARDESLQWVIETQASI